MSRNINYQTRVFKALETATMYDIELNTESLGINAFDSFSASLWQLSNFLNDEANKTEDAFLPDLAPLAELLLNMANSNVDGFITDELKLLSAATYYIYGYPGASKLIALNIPSLDNNIYRTLHCFLANKFQPIEHFDLGSKLLSSIGDYMGAPSEFSFKNITDICEQIYNLGMKGSHSEDVIGAELLKKCIMRFNSTNIYSVLQKYSNHSLKSWSEYFNIQKSKSINEFWPSQIKALKSGLLQRDISFALQMPTSAGKTQIISFVIYNYFLSNKKPCIIIVPLRSLLREVQKSLLPIAKALGLTMSVVDDIKVSNFTFSEEKSLLVATPEKLSFMERESPGILTNFGLYIFDEGHLFDSPNRGPMFELLIAKIMKVKSEKSRFLFISAVMPNLEDILNWIDVGDAGKISSDYKPTLKFTGIIRKRSSRVLSLSFISDKSETEPHHFIPNFIDVKICKSKGKSADKYFPENTPKSIAAATALKSLNLGNVAIYVGQPAWTISVAREIITGIEKFGYQLPTKNRKKKEIEQIRLYCAKFLGEDHALTEAFNYGFSIHHRQLLQSFKEIVEYSIEEEIVPLVICTSTLAQGVNLPIKTLIIHSAQTGADSLSIRDYTNLSGRSGRASKETSGNVIFIESERNKNIIRNYVSNTNLEKCFSTILKSAGKLILTPNYTIEKLYEEFPFVVSSIEAALLDELKDNNSHDESIAEGLALRTLAYYQAKHLQKPDVANGIVTIFKHIYTNISKYTNEEISKFSKTGDTSTNCKKLESIFEQAMQSKNFEKTIIIEIYKQMMSETKGFKVEHFISMYTNWSEGKSPIFIHNQVWEDILNYRKDLKKNGLIKRVDQWSIDDTTQFLQERISYEMSNLIGSIILLNEKTVDVNSQSEEMMTLIQIHRKTKYGLPGASSQKIAELGISDRSLCVDIAEFLALNSKSDWNMYEIKKLMVEQSENLITEVFCNYPDYFSGRFRQILGL